MSRFNEIGKGFIEGRIYDYVPVGFNLSYEDAKEIAKGGCLISREEWEGFHFIDKAPTGEETYVIVLKDCSVLINPKEISDTDKDDWGVVNIINKDYGMKCGKFIVSEK